MKERYAVFRTLGIGEAPVLVERFDSEMQAAHMVNRDIRLMAIDLETLKGVLPAIMLYE